MVDIAPQRCRLAMANDYVNAADRVPHAASRDCIVKAADLL